MEMRETGNLFNTSEERKSREWRKIWRGDRGDALGWGAVFIWAGLVLLAETTDFAGSFSWWDGWAVFFTGAGGIVLLGTLVRSLIPDDRRSVGAGLIFGLILLGIGLGGLVGWVWVWSAVLIAIGVTILLGVVGRRQSLSVRTSGRGNRVWDN